MIDLKAIKKRSGYHEVIDLPALVDWVERAKGFVELIFDLHDEDTIELTDEQLQRVKWLLYLDL